MRDMAACRERLAVIETAERQQHEQRWQAELAVLRRRRDTIDGLGACVTPCPERERERELVDQRIRDFHEPVFMMFQRCVEKEPAAASPSRA